MTQTGMRLPRVKDPIDESLIYNETFGDWFIAMVPHHGYITDVLKSPIDVRKVYAQYVDELWDVAFEVKKSGESILECVERIAGYDIENDEDLMLQFMDLARNRYRENGNG